MRTLLSRHHVIAAYLALFVSLGGTAYAALNIPAGSIGARELRNHSITPVKLDPRAIGASVRYWAIVDPTGHVAASRPRATTSNWGGGSGYVTWGHAIPSGCLSLATVGGIASPEGLQQGFASAFAEGSKVTVFTFSPSGAADAKRVQIVVLCS
jgi:hypothetical protein